jgi:hypothetical protein
MVELSDAKETGKMVKAWFSVMLLLTGLTAAAWSQETEAPQEPLKEYIRVTNVEMVMRVMKDGISQGGFKKEDFRLLEDGQERPINGFFELRKRMKPEPIAHTYAETAEVPGRLFLLFFWASQPQTEIDVHLDSFFNTVFQPRDRVILASNTQQVEVTTQEGVSEARARFTAKLKEELKGNHVRWEALHRDLTYEIDHMIRHIRLNGNASEVTGYLNNFTVKYRRFMREIEALSQSVNFSRMGRMADDLRAVNALKWVLFFFETNRVPMVNTTDLMSTVEAAVTTDISADILISWFKALAEIEMETVQPTARQSLYEKLRSRFIQSDTVFHYLTLNTPTLDGVQKADENPLISFKTISSDWEGIFKSISRFTGGQISKINEDPSPLISLFEAEDISYLLTYVPAEGRKKERKIEIVFKSAPTNISSRNLVYGKRIEMNETPAVRIEAITHTSRNLHLEISRFYPILTSQGPQGHLHVELIAKTGKTEPINLFSGDLVTSGHLELPLKLPHPGDWDLEAMVTDSMTKHTDTIKYHLIQEAPPAVPALSKPTLNGPEINSDLSPLLEKSAGYADKLKKAALRFFCQEKVAERIGTTSNMSRMKKWTYDYQIVLQDERLDEKRTNSKKKKKEGASNLETLYKSHYSFFLPATMLAADRQPAYVYASLGTDIINKHQTTRISAMPRNLKSGLPGGEIWIDNTDGSVLQIKLDPTTVPGFQSRFNIAAQKEKTITITDTHQYFLRFKGMQFPTSTFITETQAYMKLPATIYGYSHKIGYLKQFEPTHYSVHYEYEDYRFFDIDTNEKITGWVEE